MRTYPVVWDGRLLSVRPHAVAEGWPAPLQDDRGGLGRRRCRKRRREPLLRRRRRRWGRSRPETALVRDDAAGDAL